MKKEILLSIKDVDVNYGGINALTGASVCIDESEIVALVGPNGAGKSTILKSIFGLAPITKGDVFWHGTKINPVSYEMVERGVSFVPQGRRVFHSLTVKENLEVGGSVVGDAKLVAERLEEVLETFPILKEKLNDKSGSLSGGQQQMLAIARGLMTDPKVLLLDEPSLGLSPKFVTEVFDKIKEINENHKTAILIVEHNIKNLLRIAHRVYVLDKGKVIKSAPAAEVLNSDVLKNAFLGKGE